MYIYIYICILYICIYILYIFSQQCLLDALFEIKAQRNAKCKSRGIFCIKWHIGSFGRLMKGTWARYLGPKWKA